MNFLRKLFSKKESKPKVIPPEKSPTPPDAPATMKVWDDYGRVMEITREDWRTQILPSNFEKHWNNPDNLAAMINSALNDGFIADCLKPVRQLYAIDPDALRSTLFLAVVLLQLEKFEEAEKVLRKTLKEKGEDGILLTNLAKALNGQGKKTEAEQTLWRALEVDPNQDNGFMWYVAIERERGGEVAELAVLQSIAAMPGSWRAQLWLARNALQSRDLEKAISFYQESLQKAHKPAPSDLLMQISGDLGNQGHLPEILQLVGPHFDAEAHGLLVGNNLIKAHFDLGQLDSARKLLDKLFALNRGDWKEHLQFWDGELAKARVELNNAEGNVSPKFTMLTLEGPIWLKPTSPASELFVVKPVESTRVCLLGSAAEIATNSKRAQHQMADAPGRLSRALPLFLAEQIAMRTEATVQTLVPWMMGESASFALSSGPWEDNTAANAARQGELKNDYAITLYLKTAAEPWTMEARLIRTIDAKLMTTTSASVTLVDMRTGIQELTEKLLALLKEHVEVELTDANTLYQVPEKPHFESYILRLEQLLAVRCSTMDDISKNFLHGEREILDGMLQLCLDFPKNVNLRILLVQTLLSMSWSRPEIIPEYKDKVAKLLKDQPLQEPMHGVIQRIYNEALAIKSV